MADSTRPDLLAAARAKELLDVLSDNAYSERYNKPYIPPLTWQDLSIQERQRMTVVLLRNLINWEAFEFVCESGDSFDLLPVMLADFIDGGADAPLLCFQRLTVNAMEYAQSYIDDSLERRCPTSTDDV